MSLWALSAAIVVIISLIALYAQLSSGTVSGAGLFFTGITILVNGFILYAAYHNILNLNKCGELMK